ncbi:MAG: glycosyltransferase family 2 protein [Bacteroidia bacterium]
MSLSADDNPNPLISVISVNYNSKFEDIHKTISSIQNQSYSNLEYIVIDGASTNGSLELIQTYSDSIHELISEKDNGIYHAMNKALQRAKGTWIVFMNMGDTFSEDTDLIKRLANGVMRNHQGIVYGDTIHENAHVRYLHRAHSQIEKNRIKGLLSLNHQSIFTHQNVFHQIGMFDENKYKIMADCHWLNRVYKALGPQAFTYVEETIAVYNEFGVSSQPENLKNRYIEFSQLQKEFCSPIQVIFYQLFHVVDRIKNLIYLQLLNAPQLYKWYRKVKYMNSTKVSNLD